MDKETKKKIKMCVPNAISWAFLILLSILVGIIGYLLILDDNPPIIMNIEPLPMSKSVVQPGDTVEMTFDYCKMSDAQPSLSAFWYRESDGLIWEQKISTYSIASKGCSHILIPLVIPETIPPGEWRRVNIAEYNINILTTRTVSWMSEPITITEP